MTGLQLYAIALKIVMLVVFGSVMPQGKDDPRSKQQVTDLFNYEKGKPNFKDLTKAEVERVGVDFELDPKTEQEFRALGMDQFLLNVIRNKVKITTLTVQCEPVECEVAINGEAAGTTVSSSLTKARVKPGLVTIKVAARNFETQTRDVQVAAGEHYTAEKFVMLMLRAGLAITCEAKVPVSAPPPVCAIAITGSNGLARKGQTTAGRLTVENLPTGEYDVEASARSFFPKNEKVWIAAPDAATVAFKLDVNQWESETDLQVYDAMVGSLGGKGIFTGGSSYKSTARMRLVADAPLGMWNAQVTEYASGDRLRWDLVIAAAKWSVIYDGAKVGSTGDKKTFSGTPFAQELEHSIRLFSSMRLPLLLGQIRKLDIKKGDKLVLIAESPDERFTFHLNEDYRPEKVLHERLTAPRSQEEIEFGQYKSIGQDLMLPHAMILRYPDRQKHELIFVYEKIDTAAQIKEDLFKVPK